MRRRRRPPRRRRELVGPLLAVSCERQPDESPAGLAAILDAGDDLLTHVTPFLEIQRVSEAEHVRERPLEFGVKERRAGLEREALEGPIAEGAALSPWLSSVSWTAAASSAAQITS